MNTEDEKLSIDEYHKKTAIETNNGIWPILDKDEPSRKELEEALDMAYASRYHWSQIGEPINLARADYMISRVWSAMKKPEPAIYHGQRCLDITKETGIGDWDLAFAYEAVTRAFAVAGNKEKYEEYAELTQNAIKDVDDDQDAKLVQGELDKIEFEY